MASYLVNHFRTLGTASAFYFFRSGDRAQRSIGAMFRSLAFQIAQQLPQYKHQIEALYDSGVQLQKNEPRLLWQRLFSTTLSQPNPRFPIYVVLDGIDESDSPQTFLSLLSSTAYFPFRLILISRPTHSLSMSLSKFPDRIHVTTMSIDPTREDIALFVEKEMQSMHGSEALRQKVEKEIIKRASGNFLWVHLAVREVLNCHTHDEIEVTLQGIPDDMHLLYKRIEDTMMENLKPSDQTLAKALLTWVSCSRRPLNLDELSNALEPLFGQLLDLGRTVNQICGNFLVLDRNSRVSFVHQTAREYIAKSSKGPFAIVRAEANEEILLRCFSCLCEIDLRNKLRRSAEPALLLYAATSWPFHLQAVSAGSGSVFTALATFLGETAVLTWIQILSADKCLRTLVQASHSLAAFLDRRRTYDASIAPNLRPLEAIENMDLWATDLVKIVGKFGRNLLEMPESIYKFVPQFCPKTSAIHRQFGRKSAFSVNVSGDSHENWDDCLAKIFMGAECEALSIACVGRFFAILTSINLMVILDAETCQEVRRFTYQDRILTFCVSEDGKMIATYGFQTTRICELATGKEIVAIPSPSNSRILDMIFTKQNSALLMSFEDTIVWKLPLNETETTWQSIDLQFLHDQMVPGGNASSSPCSAALSPDGSQLAMAFRGAPLSIWALDDPHLVARCRRERYEQSGFNSKPWTPVDQVIWRPRASEVLGIYIGGVIFRWDPLEESSQEVDAAASTITCNADGDLIASSDANGTIKVWKINDFVLIYQLRYEYPVTSLAFGPDNRRIYDLRGASCNVWEPNTLIRLSDLERSGSETASDYASIAVSVTMSETEVDVKEPVTAIATGSSNRTFITGNSEGRVFSAQASRKGQTELWTSPTFMPIEHLFLSTDGKHVAIHDLGGKIVVEALELSKPTLVSSKSLFSVMMQAQDELIQQVLLSPNSDYLLVTGPTSAQLFSVGQGARIQDWRSADPNVAFKWVEHPLQTDQLLAIGADCIVVYDWSSLREVARIELDLPSSFSSSESENRSQQVRRPSDPGLIMHQSGTVVERAMLTQDKRHLLLESAHFSSATKSERQLNIIPTAAFCDAPASINALALSSSLLRQVQLPLGVLSGDRFVFLNYESWVCSWQLGSRDESRALKYYFFLPRDWLSAECLELCRLMEDGTLLIPRHGDVASIQSDLSVQW